MASQAKASRIQQLVETNPIWKQMLEQIEEERSDARVDPGSGIWQDKPGSNVVVAMRRALVDFFRGEDAWSVMDLGAGYGHYSKKDLTLS